MTSGPPPSGMSRLAEPGLCRGRHTGQVERIDRAAGDMVDKFGKQPGFQVERGQRRGDDRADFGGLRHRAQMAEMHAEGGRPAARADLPGRALLQWFPAWRRWPHLRWDPGRRLTDLGL
jgi:hypothetical protein